MTNIPACMVGGGGGGSEAGGKGFLHSDFVHRGWLLCLLPTHVPSHSHSHSHTHTHTHTGCALALVDWGAEGAGFSGDASFHRRQTVEALAKQGGDALYTDTANLPKLRVAPAVALREATEGLKSEDWAQQFAALDLLRGVVVHCPDALSSNASNLHALVTLVIGHVKSLRSSVSRNSCMAFVDMFNALGRAMDPELEHIVGILIPKIVEGNAFLVCAVVGLQGGAAGWGCRVGLQGGRGWRCVLDWGGVGTVYGSGLGLPVQAPHPAPPPSCQWLGGVPSTTRRHTPWYLTPMQPRLVVEASLSLSLPPIAPACSWPLSCVPGVRAMRRRRLCGP